MKKEYIGWKIEERYSIHVSENVISNTMNWRSFIVLVTIVSSSLATNLEGQFNSQEFFLFLNKFGFIKTDRNSDQKATYGYIFGNVTATSTSNESQSLVTLAVLDRHHFLEFYGNR